MKLFSYVLNEETAGDEFAASSVSEQITVGRRSGFALYTDRYLERRILVGVSAGEVARNSMFDGPFDQMPDNFISGNTLAEALIQRRGDLAGRIDRRGNLEGLAGRVIIVPYLEYEHTSELGQLDQCAARAATRAEYYRCFDRGAMSPAADAENMPADH